MKRKCELCERTANIHCQSDGASLCWKCDAQVHAANFIVAHHSRTLLCYHCHSLTPWHASGYNLSPTFSTCNTCASTKNAHINNNIYHHEDSEEESQVVPWSSTSPSPISATAQQCSSREQQSTLPISFNILRPQLSSSQLIGHASGSPSWRQFKSQKQNM